MQHTLKALGTIKCLKLKHYLLLSTSAFKFNLRRYNLAAGVAGAKWGIRATLITGLLLQVAGRGLHSSTFRLNVSTSCGVRWVHDFTRQGDTGRSDQNGSGWAEKWTSVGPWWQGWGCCTGGRTTGARDKPSSTSRYGGSYSPYQTHVESAWN
jgi:hypothetical protein